MTVLGHLYWTEYLSMQTFGPEGWYWIFILQNFRFCGAISLRQQRQNDTIWNKQKVFFFLTTILLFVSQARRLFCTNTVLTWCAFIYLREGRTPPSAPFTLCKYISLASDFWYFRRPKTRDSIVIGFEFFCFVFYAHHIWERKKQFLTSKHWPDPTNFGVVSRWLDTHGWVMFTCWT